ncbi:putative Ig domain-containing protein [Candidatus Epulonipiscium viviparus]|uniref:putative Ig domain-containing protein n=1 Tax=Candidatus Epulonipiscium viviparus TaxID=420336 RepID=UPI0027380A7C|nr:putative Ig domain-containing protein [Candidatus Epulopiscium viviparus]
MIGDGGGEISGTLTITADDQAPQVITLNGFAANLAITTEQLKTGSAFVPYTQLIQTNNISNDIVAKFSIIDGEKPDWLTLDPNTGYLHGMPKAAGEHTFMVKAEFSSDDDKFSEYDLSPSYAKFTITTSEELVNEDGIPVDSFVTDGFEIKTPLPKIEEIKDHSIKLTGDISEIVDVYIDGQKLVKNSDYKITSSTEEISITIFSDVFEDLSEDEHIVAAEFVDDTAHCGP